MADLLSDLQRQLGLLSGAFDASAFEKLRDVAEDRNIRAVVLRIDSPGGSAIASDNIWRAVRDLAETKPRRAVFLTEAGWELVKRLRHRYDVVVRFLISLGIPEDVAHAEERVAIAPNARSALVDPPLTRRKPTATSSRPTTPMASQRKA